MRLISSPCAAVSGCFSRAMIASIVPMSRLGTRTAHRSGSSSALLRNVSL
jgi:hypothetical protein